MDVVIDRAITTSPDPWCGPPVLDPVGLDAVHCVVSLGCWFRLIVCTAMVHSWRIFAMFDSRPHLCGGWNVSSFSDPSNVRVTTFVYNGHASAVHLYTYVRAYLCMSLHVHMCTSLTVHLCTSLPIHMWMSLPVHMWMSLPLHMCWVYLYTCVWAYLYTCVWPYLYTCGWAYLYTCAWPYLYTCV